MLSLSDNDSLYGSNEKKHNEGSSLLSQGSHRSYHSLSTTEQLEPAQPTTHDPFVNQIKELLKLRCEASAFKVLRVGLEEESKRGFITDQTTPEDLKRILSERTSEEIDSKITSLTEVKNLFSREYQWFGFHLFGKPNILLEVEKTVKKLQDTLPHVRDAEAARKESFASAKRSLLSGT